MSTPGKLATPAAAATPVMPSSTPVPGGFVTIARVTVPVKPVAVLPNASLAVTCTAGVIAAPATASLGCTVNASAVAGAGVTVTFAVWVIAVPPIVAVTVLDWATVELMVPVATPLAPVGPAGWVSVLPAPLAASTTAAPATGLPKTSRAVTVMVLWFVPLDATIDPGAAPIVDWPCEIAPAVTVTLAVWVTATPPTVAETDLPPAAVELSVPVAMPLASVRPGWVSVLPPPVAASTTGTPATGLPNASRAVTVIVL